MPTYSYRCQNCQTEFDAVQRITEDALKDCPKCHTPNLKRLITSGNFILKGSGWYSDLYSGSSNKTEGSASSTSNATAASTSTPSAPSTSDASSAASTTTSSSDSGGSSSGSGSSTPSTPSSGGSAT